MAQESTAVLSFTEEEKLMLQAIAAGPEPHRQRARALLALAAGKSPGQAARAAGMRVTQVMYWRGRFRNGGMTIFPEALPAADRDVGERAAPPEPPVKKGRRKKKGAKRKDKEAEAKGTKKKAGEKDGKKKAGKKSAKEKKAGSKKKKKGAAKKKK